jgi:hypothetical protein
MIPEQQAREEHFLAHTSQQQDGRYIVRLPIKEVPNQLGTSRLSAERRLHAIERRLERDPELKIQYHNFMKEYEDLGHMELVNSQEGKNTCYFLPHRSVFKETSSTTKTRVVFDRCAKSSNGLSLNVILQVGPTVQQGLYSIVLRFRTHQLCFTADIAKIYCQIEITSPRQGPTENFVEIFFRRPHPRVPTHYSHLWDPFSTILGNMVSEETSRRQTR